MNTFMSRSLHTYTKTYIYAYTEAHTPNCLHIQFVNTNASHNQTHTYCCAYVCMYIYIYMHNIYIYVCVCVHIYVCVCVCIANAMDAHVHVLTYMRIHAHMHTHIHRLMHTCTHTHSRIYMHTNINSCTPGSLRRPKNAVKEPNCAREYVFMWIHVHVWERERERERKRERKSERVCVMTVPYTQESKEQWMVQEPCIRALKGKRRRNQACTRKCNTTNKLTHKQEKKLSPSFVSSPKKRFYTHFLSNIHTKCHTHTHTNTHTHTQTHTHRVMVRCFSVCSACVCLRNTCSHEHACVCVQTITCIQQGKAKVIFGAHVCIHTCMLCSSSKCVRVHARYTWVWCIQTKSKSNHQPKTHETRYPRSLRTRNQTRKPWHLHPHAQTHTPVHTSTPTCTHTHTYTP
jgi:hypothetical protein